MRWPASMRSPAAVIVQPMRRRHLADVVRIERLGSPRPWTRQVFCDELAGANRVYTVARRGSRVVGFAGLWIVPGAEGGEAHLTNISVDPDARRTGVATVLLVHLARRAIELGCTGWTLEVRRSGEAAQQLYRRFGFAPVGVRARYYEQSEDALIMWCHDLQSPEYRERLDRLAAGVTAGTIEHVEAVRSRIDR